MVVIRHLAYLFRDRLGLATGVATLPFGIVLFPPVAKMTSILHGWRILYLSFVFLALAALILVQFAKRARVSSGDDQGPIVDGPKDANTGVEPLLPTCVGMLKLLGF